MKRINWKETGVIYEETTTNGPIADRKDGKVATRLEFEDGTYITANIYEASAYASRDFCKDKKVRYIPSLLGLSRGKEIEIYGKEDGTGILKIQTLGFNALQIEVDSYKNLLAWYHMIKDTLEKKQTRERWKIPE